jgi:hypothetical protein
MCRFRTVVTVRDFFDSATCYADPTVYNRPIAQRTLPEQFELVP